MRILLQILGLLIVVWMGWNEPYRDVAASVFPWAGIPPSRLSLIKARAAAASVAAAAATPVRETRRTPEAPNPLSHVPKR